MVHAYTFSLTLIVNKHLVKLQLLLLNGLATILEKLVPHFKENVDAHITSHMLIAEWSLY